MSDTEDPVVTHEPGRSRYEIALGGTRVGLAAYVDDGDERRRRRRSSQDEAGRLPEAEACAHALADKIQRVRFSDDHRR